MLAARYDAGWAFCPRIRYLSGRIYCWRALCPLMAAVSGRKCPRGAGRDTFVPERGIIPGEFAAGGHFVPKWQQFLGGNALGVLREILLSPKEVSFREKPTPGRHFVPKWQQFPGGTLPRRALCPQMAAVSGRNPPPGGTLSPNGSSYRENSHPPRHPPRHPPGPCGKGICIVGEIFFVEQMHLLKKIVTFGHILQKIYLNIFLYLCILLLAK